jgi:hypothetical protein
MTGTTDAERPGPYLGCAILTGIAVALFAVRLTGLPNLLDNEYRVGACVLDAIQNHDWICPHDSLGNTDKPPMLTWLAALVSLATGRVTPFTLYLPTALSTLAIAGLLEVTGRREFGGRAGFLAGLGYLLSDVGARQIATARWDGLFAFTVALAAFAASRAWRLGRGWVWFWLAAAVSTLTKGPLGLLLAALGLLAVVWERRSGTPAPLRGSQSAGLAAYLLLTVGWFALAYREVGPHLIDNMIRGELVGHIVEHSPGRRFITPIVDFLTNFAPWSILAVSGFVRIYRTPAPSDRERRFERFLLCWFAAGLLVFCVSPHNPSRLIYPVIPPAAAIAGRELDRLTRRYSLATILSSAGVVATLALAFFALQYHRLEGKKPAIRETLAIMALARTVREQVGETFPLTYAEDCPYALQLSLNTLRPTVSYEEAATLLRGDAAAFVAVGDEQRLRRALGPDAPAVYEVARTPPGDVSHLGIVSNHSTLEWLDPMETRIGPMIVHLDDVRLRRATSRELVLSPGGRGGLVTVVNSSSDPRSLRIRVEGDGLHVKTIAAGESWRLAVP